MIQVGVIGCGRIAQTRHLPEYAANPEVKIAAVYDLCKERAGEMGKMYGAAVYDSYEELLNDPGIDAVSVCVANACHCEVSVKAMRAGKHVLCEKPMAVSLEQCEKMVQVSRETGKYLMIGHNQRFTRAHREAKRLLEQGAIGELLTFRTSFGHAGPESWTIDRKQNWFFDKTQAQFGAMADLGVHKTDLLRYLTGREIAAVKAYMGTLHKRNADGSKIGVDDNAFCIYEMEDGTAGILSASWTYYGKEDNSTVLYGSDGILYIYCDPRYPLVLEKKNGEKLYYEMEQMQTNDNQTKSGVIDAWVDSILEKKKPEVSGEDALNTMRAVFAAVRSASGGQAEKIR